MSDHPAAPRPSRRRRWIAALCCVVALPALWTIAVDWSWFMEDCPDCNLHRDVAQHRVFTIPVREQVFDDEFLLQKVARDLGVPCRHPRMPATRFHKHRWWGLIYCAGPCWNGTWYLDPESDWYGPTESTKVAALATDDPDLPAEFARRLLRDEESRDYELFRSVLDRADVRWPAPPADPRPKPN